MSSSSYTCIAIPLLYTLQYNHSVGVYKKKTCMYSLCATQDYRTLWCMVQIRLHYASRKESELLLFASQTWCLPLFFFDFRMTIECTLCSWYHDWTSLVTRFISAWGEPGNETMTELSSVPLYMFTTYVMSQVDILTLHTYCPMPPLIQLWILLM